MSSKPILRDLSQQNQPDASEAHQHDLPDAERRPADVEMARVLKTAAAAHGFGPVQWQRSPTGNMIHCTTSSSPWLITSS